MFPSNTRCCFCATMVNVSAFFTAYISACKYPEHSKTTFVSYKFKLSFHFSFKCAAAKLLILLKKRKKSTTALESENVKSVGERGSRRVSDFHPRHQWSSLNSSTQNNPQPVGKCEKLHKVIYSLMSILPKNSSGTQFKDTTFTFSLFSKIIPRGLYWVLSTYYFFPWMNGMLRIDK